MSVLHTFCEGVDGFSLHGEAVQSPQGGCVGDVGKLLHHFGKQCANARELGIKALAAGFECQESRFANQGTLQGIGIDVGQIDEQVPG